MVHNNTDYKSSLYYVKDLFNKRVLKHIDDKLFITDYSNKLANKLHNKAIKKLEEINCLEFDLSIINEK
jgi:hypothetical protein